MTAPHVAIAYDCVFPVDTGGGERVYRRLAEVLVRRGSPVDYVTRARWQPGGEPRAEFRVVPVWRGEIYDAAGTRTPRGALRFAVALFRHFRRHRGDYDIVIVSALPVLNVFAVALAVAGTRTFLVTDWLEVWTWRKWRGYSGALVGTTASVLQFLAIRLGNLITVNSAFTGERIRRYRPRAETVVLGLVDVIDEPGPRPASTVEGAPQRAAPVALFVGRHIADKRLAALPAALAVARRTLPDLQAVVIGSGPETPAVREQVSALGLAGAVTFPGRVSDEALAASLRSASVLVNPSAREGFGLVVAEAAAHGTPSVVVSGEDNAAAELVEDGVNGFVAASVDPEVLGAAIVRAVEAGEPLRHSTLEWFARERQSRGLQRSVDELLERHRSARVR